MGDKSGFPLVTVFDSDIVVSPSDIELSKDLGFFYFVNEVRDERKRIGASLMVWEFTYR